MHLDDQYGNGRSALILFIVGFFLVVLTRNSVKLEFSILGYIFAFVAFFKSLNYVRQKNFLIVVTFAFSLLFLIVNLIFRVHIQDYVLDLFTPVKNNSFANMAQEYIDKARDKYKKGLIPSIYDKPDGIYYLSEIYDETFDKYSPYGNLILLDSSYILIEEDSTVSFNPIFVYSIYITDGEYAIGTPKRPLAAKKLKASQVYKVRKKSK